MVQATFSIRMDDELKSEFEDVCESFGMSMTTAINVFAKKVVHERKIPFEITADPSSQFLETFMKLREQIRASCPGGMTLDEINALIDDARSERR